MSEPAHSEEAHIDLEHELDLMVERLRQQFDGVDDDTVDEIVHRHAARFEHARVQNFISVLTEKAAKQSLKGTAA